MPPSTATARSSRPAARSRVAEAARQTPTRATTIAINEDDRDEVERVPGVAAGAGPKEIEPASPETSTPNQSKNMKMKSRISRDPGDLLSGVELVYVHLISLRGSLAGRSTLTSSGPIRGEMADPPRPAGQARARAACNGVDQQHRDRHRADAAGDRA